MLKRSLILSALLSSSAFAIPVTFQIFNTSELEQPPDSCGEADPRSDLAPLGWDNQCDTQFGVDTCAGDTLTTVEYVVHCGNCGAGTTLTSIGGQQICKPNSCPSGMASDSYGMCAPSADDPARGLDQHDGDQDGCNNAGGYYFADGSCNTGGEALAKVMNDPTAVIGALLTVGGVALTSAGALAVPFTAGASSGAMAIGGYATVAGLGMMGVTAGGLMASTSSPSTDSITAENRIKVSLTSSGGQGGSTAGSNVTKTNTTTQKVEQSTFIPDSVKASMANASNVDKTTGTLKTPISTAGVQNTTYDYSTMTATTTTHEATSTSSNPVTTTKTSSFTISQNPDGSVTTTPSDTSSAPTVSGSGGGTVVSSPTATGGTGTGTGTGSGSGDKDYTAVLNDIKKNTGDTASFLDDILSMFDSTEEVDTSSVTGSNADGHEGFGGYDNDLKGTFDDFIFTDPLGLNNISAGSSIPTYGFTILGHYFVIMDQALLDQLPLDLIRSLFLFMSALAGFITVFSGV